MDLRELFCGGEEVRFCLANSLRWEEEENGRRGRGRGEIILIHSCRLLCA